ncbi:MAG TPA: cytochrome c peroxidase [Cellvibrionaceae bacterium]|nr:cytochrome c peroxidase [Cellvibrionaceae bacterium]HNG58542.1 cytochrome c peroxidase [Cellvibrionaceae bacterium]
MLKILPLIFLFSTATAFASSDEESNMSVEISEIADGIRSINDSDYNKVDAAKVTLGQALFFDKELSGNRNISCSTCHSPITATTDGLSINLGEGAKGLSVSRDPGKFPPEASAPLERGQRNAPALFDRGAKEFTVLMHDGRFQVDKKQPSGFLSPAGDLLPLGFNNMLEVISIFAFTEIQEMLGQVGENEVADAGAAQPFTGIWSALVERIKKVPAYKPLFAAAYPELGGDINKITIVHVGRAIAHFQSASFRASGEAPFDRYMRGDNQALSKEAVRGLKVFVGKGNCVSCHSGPFFTDHKFHALGVPQIGPGFGGVGNDQREDFGREGVTQNASDRYKFITPPLRNVALTGPWGHDGAFNSLEAIVRHHLEPKKSLLNYNPEQRVLPSREDLDKLDLIALMNPTTTSQIASRIEINGIRLSDSEFKDLMGFLNALTDPKAVDLRKTVPKKVPSGATLAD